MEYKIHLIRHGVTEGNQKRWHYGSMDIPLIKEGVTQLKHLREEGIYPQIHGKSCYTSGMLRTEQTFVEIFGNVGHMKIEKLREINFGEFEGLTYNQLKDDFRYKKWIEDKTGKIKLPGGESKEEFYKRVNSGFDIIIQEQKIKSNKENRISEAICVCHGGVIACLMLRFFENSENHFADWIPEPGRGFTISFCEGKSVNHDVI